MAKTKIIGLTGTHGTGKSTVLGALAERGYSVERRSLAREAQARFGIGVGTAPSIEDSILLQDCIAELMIARDLDILRSDAAHKDGVVFVDRSPLDVAAYADVWMIENKEELGWRPLTALKAQEALNVRARKLMHHLSLQYHAVGFFLIEEAIPFVAEAGRASEKNRVTMQEAAKQYRRTGHHFLPKPHGALRAPGEITHTIRTVSIEDRANEMVALIRGDYVL